MIYSNVGSKEKFIDIIKGLAILEVVVFHTQSIIHDYSVKFEFTEIEFLNLISKYFSYGPYVFFFISGYLMSNIYDSNILKSNSNQFSLRKFYIKRFARIYPLWMFFLFVSYYQFKKFDFGYYAKTMTITEEYSNLTTLLLASTFLLFLVTPMWNWLVPGGWSIVSEVFFYLLFPMIRKMRFNQIIALLNVLLVVAFILIYTEQIWSSLDTYGILRGYLNLKLYNCLPFFIGGMLVNEISAGNRNFNQLVGNNLTKLNVISILALSMILPNANGSNAEALLTLVVTVILGVLVLKSKLCLLLLVYLGKHSYFIYFFHFQLLLLIQSYYLDRYYSFMNSISLILLLPILTTFVLIVSMLFSRLSMNLFENPSKRFIHKLFGIKF
jgi:peptidoglycan/LPS O-acetylase OafA/YrhL